MGVITIKKLGIILGIVALFFAVKPVFAADFSLFGGASYVSPGNLSNTAVQLVSNSTSAYSGVDFVVPAGTTFGSLTNLQADYKVALADCGGGSPRFQINIDGKNIFVYFGPYPNFSGCLLNAWTNSGNFILSKDYVFDLTQYGGAFYGTYNQALALLGTRTVTGIQLVVDSGWKFTEGQTVLVDNVVINDKTTTFEPTTVSICHLEKKSSNNYHLITVDPNAKAAHLRHGDKLPGIDISTDCKLLTGKWQLSINNGTYLHDMFIDSISPTGAITGHGGYPAGTGPSYSWPYNWNLTGQISGLNVTLTLSYQNSYTATITGTVNGAANSMTGGAGTGGVFNWSASR